MKKALLTLLLLLLPFSVYAAGSGVTESRKEIRDNLYTLTFSWTADDSNGTVPATSTTSDGTAFIAGKYIVMVVTNPGTAPTALYDITLTDSDGVDVMGGSLLNRSATATEQAVPYVGTVYSPRPVTSALTLNITNNSENSATGTVVIYLSR